jgi:PAB-dependent poly(A)-specific ribonuclease subunit 3
MLSGRAFDELDATYQSLDACEMSVAAEFGAGRVLRVLLHLNSALSGSKNLGAVWSEAGERYLLVLFLDYVFNQTDDMGRPMLNYGHVVACLMKVDASDTEKLLLVSHDERTILVASYLEIREAIDFLELRKLRSDSAYYS